MRIKRSDLDKFIAAGTSATAGDAEAFWSGDDFLGAGATRPGAPALWERFGRAASRLGVAVTGDDAGELAEALGELGDASKALGEAMTHDAVD